MRRFICAALVLVLLQTTFAAAQDAPTPTPKKYAGFDGYSRSITCASPEVQAWFDQGIQLLYGFNHDEAIRSFEQAAALDPQCAMAWWGIALANGPHINNPVVPPERWAP